MVISALGDSSRCFRRLPWTLLILLLLSSTLTFRFHKRIATRIQNINVRYLRSPHSAIPFFGWLDLESLRSREDMVVMASPHQRVNSPVNRLRRKRQRRYQPENEMEDPYVVAVLIALAQAQRRSCNTATYFKVLNAPISQVNSGPLY